MTHDLNAQPGAVRRSAILARGELSPIDFDAEFRFLRGNTYISRAAILTARNRVIAVARAAHGSPVVAGTAAAILHGTAWYDQDFEVELIRPPTASGRRATSTTTHRLDLDPSDIVEIGGVLTTSVIRTAFDIGRQPPPWRALGYLDALARATGFQPTDLKQYADAQRRRRNVCLVRELAMRVDGRAESPPESWTRNIMLAGGLPTPDLQIEVSDASGYIYARIDLGYPELKIGIEYDGEAFHSTDQQRAKDQIRDSYLDHDGWHMIRIRREAFKDPSGIVAEIEQAMRSRGGYRR